MPFHAVTAGCASLAHYLKFDLRSVVLWFRPKGGILVPGSPGLLQNPFQRRSLIRYPPHACPFPIWIARLRTGSAPAWYQHRTPPCRCPRVLHLTICLVNWHLGFCCIQSMGNVKRNCSGSFFWYIQFVEGLDTLHPLWYCRHLRPCLPPRRLLPLGCTLNLFNVRFPSGGA